jgi:hypothetical protein
MKRILALSVLVALLLAITVLSAGAAPMAVEVRRYVIGGGGGRSEAGDYVLRGTAGQPVAGSTVNPPYDLCAGFWCGFIVYDNFVYLPLILRE